MARRVLVVDDETAIVEGLTTLFGFEEIETAGAGNRLAAEAILAEQFFPLVVADLCLHTQEEGIALIEHLRSTSPTSRIVVLSGYVTPAVEAQLLELGVSLVLTKPSTSDVILDAVNALLTEIEREAGSQESLNLEELYMTVRRRLYDIPRRRFNLSHDRAEDVLHEAWLLFLQKRNLVRSAMPWLAGTVVNLSKQQLDRRTRKREVDEETSNLSELPDGRLGVSEDVLALRQALGQVDERTRTLCAMIGIDGLSYDEVSAATGLPLGSIGPLYIRAKKKLRAALEH
jgi:RNA polymerase sigma factor (sigma-70 family)